MVYINRLYIFLRSTHYSDGQPYRWYSSQHPGLPRLGRDVVLVLQLLHKGLLLDEVHPVVAGVGEAVAALSTLGHQLDPVGLDVLLHVVALDKPPE